MMTLFSYEAIDSKGQPVSGQLSANTESQAASELIKQELAVIKIAEVTSSEDSNSTKRLKQQDILIALYELSSMLNAGVSAVEAVTSQAESSAHPKLRLGFKLASKTLRHGGSFEQAIESSGIPLPDYVGYLIRAGEASGKLGVAMTDACDQLEYDLNLKNETKSALIYPSILIVSGILAVLMMFVYVVPSFTNLLEEAQDLPWLAWAVLSTGKWANENLILVFLLLILPPVTLLGLWSHSPARLYILQLVERAPVIGEWVTQSDVASWSKVLSSLIKNRVDLILALSLAAEAVRMPSRRQKMNKVKNAVRSGETMSSALEANQCLTPTGYNLIRVGEKSGTMETMLAALAKLYAEQAKQRMKKVIALIEPVAILCIGLVMGVIIIGIMLAITSANDIPL